MTGAQRTLQLLGRAVIRSVVHGRRHHSRLARIGRVFPIQQADCARIVASQEGRIARRDLSPYTSGLIAVWRPRNTACQLQPSTGRGKQLCVASAAFGVTHDETSRVDLCPGAAIALQDLLACTRVP